MLLEQTLLEERYRCFSFEDAFKNLQRENIGELKTFCHHLLVNMYTLQVNVLKTKSIGHTFFMYSQWLTD